MNYSLSDLMHGASIMSRRIFGRRDEYTISFTKESDDCWYVDYPNWPFEHHNLMMVSNADKLCEILSYDGTHAKLKVRVKAGSEEMPKEAIHLSKLDSSLAGGADYHVDLEAANSFGGNIWLCPVTLFVLGQYPDNMWVTPLELDNNKMTQLGLR